LTLFFDSKFCFEGFLPFLVSSIWDKRIKIKDNGRIKVLDVKGLALHIHMAESYGYRMVSNESIPHTKLETRTMFERNQIDNRVINDGFLA
jgi:hypothetical protein